MRLNHIMVDLETRGTMAGCIILSIGAVEFNPLTEELGKEFYTVISTPDSKERYLREEQGTMDWWAKQSEEARKVLAESEHPDAPALPQALAHFNQWLSSIGTTNSFRIYGNGADFDNPILINAYDAGGVKPFFGTWGGRCYRTLKNLDELFGDALKFHKLDKERHRTGTHHNALDDAKSQALHLMANLARLRRSILNGGEE